MIVYKNVPYEFNWALWQQAIAELAEKVGPEFLAEYLGVSEKTIWNWQRDNSAYAEFKHPNMANFLKVCNETSHLPAHFFTTGE
jgi:hypothetical protein